MKNSSISLLNERLMATAIDIPRQAPETIIVIIIKTLKLEDLELNDSTKRNT